MQSLGVLIVEELTVVDQEVADISKDEVRKALQKMKTGEAVLMTYPWR